MDPDDFSRKCEGLPGPGRRAESPRAGLGQPRGARRSRQGSTGRPTGRRRAQRWWYWPTRSARGADCVGGPANVPVPEVGGRSR